MTHPHEADWIELDRLARRVLHAHRATGQRGKLRREATPRHLWRRLPLAVTEEVGLDGLHDAILAHPEVLEAAPSTDCRQRVLGLALWHQQAVAENPNRAFSGEGDGAARRVPMASREVAITEASWENDPATRERIEEEAALIVASLPEEVQYTLDAMREGGTRCPRGVAQRTWERRMARAREAVRMALASRG